MNDFLVPVNAKLAEIPLAMIRENPAALRKVDKKQPKYIEIVDSIRKHGVLNPIVVRKQMDAATGVTFYGLVDGLHRNTGAQDAGLETIPARIVEGDDDTALKMQIITNCHRVQTKPKEFTEALQRLLASDPLMSIAQVAQDLTVSVKWVEDRLSLKNLAAPLLDLVNEDKINLTNAYALAKLKDHAEQLGYADRAQTESPSSFCPMIQNRVKEIQEAKRQGREAAPKTFQPVAFAQTLGVLKTEMENPTVAPFLHRELGIKTGLKDFVEAFRLGIQWALHMDPKSVEVQKTEYEQNEEKKKTEKEKRDRERAEKKAADARLKAVEAEETLKKLKEVAAVAK